jgi:hypothetical protein
MFADKVQSKDFVKMAPEYQELVRKVLTIQSDCEIGGPHLYVESMLPIAPTRLDKLIVARTAAEEIDHFRKFARVAAEIGLDVSFVLSMPNQKRYVETFRGEIKTWEDFAVFGCLIDRIGRYQLEEFIGCSYAPIEPLLADIIRGSSATSITAKRRRASSPRAAESQRKESSVRSITGISRRSTCSAIPFPRGPSATSIGGSNAGPTRRHAPNISKR